MSNSYYNHGSYPTTGAPGTSASMRSELDSITSGFNLLPTISGNGSKAVVVNSGATALTVTTGTLALAGNFATTGAYNTTLIQGATTSLTLPLVSGTLATLAGTEEFTNKTLTSSVGKGTWTTSGTWTLPALTLGGAITYGGVTLSNAVTGTGNMVLSASPTLTGTIAAASQTLSGTLGVTGVATFTAQPIMSSLTASKPVFTDASKGLTSTGTLAYDQGGTGQTSYAAGDIVYASGVNTLAKLTIGTTGQRLVVAAGLPSWATDATIGTVTSVGWTGGIVSVATATTTPAFTIAGTSGGIPYFASGTTWATSAALAANALVLGGGAGAAPATTTTGTGVVTALGVNTGSAGAMVLFDGALGTPASGVATNLTGLPLTTGVTGTLPVANGGTGLTAGTSGGVLAYTATGTLASSTLLAANALMIGGGAGAAPSTTTTGAGVVTALGIAPGSTGGMVLTGGAFSGTSVTASSLTSGRVTYAGTAGLLQDSANLTFDGTLLTTGTLGVTTAAIVGGTRTGFTSKPFQVISPYASTDTTEREIAFFGSNEDAQPFGVSVLVTGNATAASRIINLQTKTVGVSNSGVLHLQKSGSGTVSMVAGAAQVTSTGLNSTAIGATTPSTGAFTTLSASGATNLATGGVAIPTQLGTLTAPANVGQLQQVFNGAAAWGAQTTVGGETDFGWNFYYYGGFKSRLADVASRLSFNAVSGRVSFWTAPNPGSADAALTFTEALRIDATTGVTALGAMAVGNNLAVTGTLSASGDVSANNGLSYITGVISPSSAASGKVMELTVDSDRVDMGGTFRSTISSFDRTNTVYGDLNIQGLSVGIAPSGTIRGLFSSTGLAVTGTIKSTISGLSSGAVIEIGNAGTGFFGGLGISDGGTYPVQLWGSSLAFLTGNPTYGSATEKMRLDSSGNLGIGTTAPAANLNIFAANTVTNSNGNLYVQTSTTAGTDVGGQISLGGYHNGTSSSTPFASIAGRKENSTAGNQAGYLAFSTDTSGGTNTERARFNSTGALVFAGGTTTANGIGITFPATQSASTDANTLDDYEEGTWTPSIGGTATYTYQTGRYTKIGRMVYVSAIFQVNVIGTGSTAQITGLPFSGASGYIGAEASFSVSYFSSIASNVVTLYANATSASVQFYGLTAAAGSVAAISPFQNSTRIDFSGWYIAAN